MLKKIFFKFLIILRKVFIWFVVLSIATTIIYRWINPPITPLMIWRVCEQLFDSDKEVKLTKDWVPLSEISPQMPLAVVAAEDQKFSEHIGFDIDAMEKALQYNQTHKGKVRGASTISQQVAKNVFLFPDRTYLRKALEVYFTFLIEIIWSKERILEVYLNVIEMGEGIYGTEAAAQHYYKKKAAQLSKYECAAIASILPNPRVWSPLKPNARVARKIKRVMVYMKYIDLKDVLADDDKK
ncbi:MAG: monofunctional biosynthetic peptidoglycan transglycosylase [Bacteroidetes bacterium]|nr:monofunctional biosynthetic peptidoglycan transglycosylase [Bacteroidota bacterium]